METPRLLETHAEWHSADVANPDSWTFRFTPNELEQLDAALAHARDKGRETIDLDREDFPLGSLASRLLEVERELIDGRGFALLSGIDRERYSREEMELLYWGVGMHLGRPWPQNKHGHVLGDVIDQGKKVDDPTSRGNEIGGLALPYHSDGSDLVGLMCLNNGKSGGTSTVANAVAIHNDLVREEPELAAELYKPQPNDFRGEEREGTRPWYTVPVFSSINDRLFVRYIRPYILASQRHESAPRLTEKAKLGIERVNSMANDRDYNVYMDLEPGEMQFVNNYHVLHARTEYQDDREAGKIRHLKRLWLETNALEARPEHFSNFEASHWNERRSASRIATP